MEKIAMYIRISLEDTDLQNGGGKAESASISNQRELISRYIAGNDEFAGYEVGEYSDDGYTDRNLEKPGFQEMLGQCR